MFTFHSLIHKESDEDVYSAICLELNISVDGDTPEQAFENLQKAVVHYVGCAISDKDYQALSRPAPREYWEQFLAQSETRVELEKIVA